jgi:predicted GIY-YIG superfamily endonuclease
MKTYKVYLIKRRCDNFIMYVGLTSQLLAKRFQQHVDRKKFVKKDYFMEIVQEDITLQEAVTLEELLIEQYTTRKTGWNVSPKSINGYSNLHSEEQKAKWSMERKGKPFPKNDYRRTTPNTPEHNKKISEANSRPVICLNDGKTYRSMRQACVALCLQESKVSLVCNGKRPHTRGYKFKFL